MRTCSKCGVAKDLRSFYKTAKGLRGDCKACVLESRRARYASDPDTFRQRVRAYQARSPEAKEATRQRRLTKTTPTAIVRADRDKALRRNHGISADDFDRMLVEQGGRCAICTELEPGRYWCVDHDHQTGQVRGILCWHCNVGLGHFRDDPASLVAAIDYLMASRVEAVA